MKYRVLCVSAILLAGSSVAIAQTDDPNNSQTPASPAPPVSGGTGAVVNTFTIPTAATPVGLENDGNSNLLLTDIGNTDFSTISSADGSLISGPFATGSTGNPIGITTNAGTISITDTVDMDVDQYDTAGNFIASFDVSGFSTFPEGITIAPFDGNFYVVDGAGGNQVGQFSPAGTLLNSFPVNGASQDGIAFDNLRCVFWLYDSGTDTVRSYDSSFTELTTFPGTIAAGFSGGEGVGVIDNSVFVMATGAGTVVEFDLTGAQSAANADTLCPQDVLPPPPAVPTLSQTGLAILALMLLLGGGLVVRRYV